ncbi:MAG: DUF1311 domain-containing protein [Ottowia sp.]|nr:DUF1311 domain-containing protein [Ottowia sp.]
MKKHAFSTPFAALVALSLSGASALAQPQEELAPGFDACVQQSGGATPQLVACAQAAYEFWDKRLNEEYKKARQACFDETCREKLLGAQRHWIQYKEAMGDVLFRSLQRTGGSMGRLNAVTFSAEETKKQTLLLQELLRSSGAE